MKNDAKDKVKKLQRLEKSGEYIHYLGLINPRKPGVRILCLSVEYQYFPPGTPKNNDYFYTMLTWEGMVWSVLSLMPEFDGIVKKKAGEHGLQVVDGVPHFRDSSFPLCGENVFTLESTKDQELSPEMLKHALFLEDQKIGNLMKGFNINMAER